MEQFKTLEEIRDYLSKLEKWFGRAITAGDHPTLYLNNGVDGEPICGVRRKDYLFSACGNWIMPSRQHGLSFSAHWQHLKGQYKLHKKHSPDKKISVFWILEKADIPSGLTFVVDDDDPRHYLLSVTRRMHVEELRSKLEWIADRMAVIKDAQVAL